MNHEIKSRQDVQDLRDVHGYGDDVLFTVVIDGEVGEVKLTIPDLLFYYDEQEFTVNAAL